MAFRAENLIIDLGAESTQLVSQFVENEQRIAD